MPLALLTACGSADRAAVPSAARLAPAANVVTDAAVAAGDRSSPEIGTALRFWQSVQLGELGAAYALLDPTLRARTSPSRFRAAVGRRRGRFAGVVRVVDAASGPATTSVFLTLSDGAPSASGPGASVQVTRRGRLRFVGGDAAGLLVTRVPG